MGHHSQCAKLREPLAQQKERAEEHEPQESRQELHWARRMGGTSTVYIIGWSARAEGRGSHNEPPLTDRGRGLESGEELVCVHRHDLDRLNAIDD
jgi:hypothetical protein